MKTKQVEKSPIYPYSDWEIIEDTFDVETNLQDETIFATGNGYIGMRGTFEEGYYGPLGTSVNGTYLNGFYESEHIIYGEEAFGYAKYSQTMLNVTDSKIINLYIEDEHFNLFQGTILSYKRVLDMKNGILKRDITWESPSGKQVKISITRLILLSNKNLAAISYVVTPLNFDGQVTLVSVINGEVQNQRSTGDPRAGSVLSGQVLKTESIEGEGTFATIRQRTKNTNFVLQASIDNSIESNNSFEYENLVKEQRVEVKYKIAAKKNQDIKLSKYISYFTSKDFSESELYELSKDTVKAAKEKGFDALLSEQKLYLDRFWYHSDVEIYGDPSLQQSIRYNMIQLLQSVGRDGKTNISAKGLTGEGYEGHYFWDTETYILPFFLYTNPEISKKLLEYRYSTLDHARERAKEMSQKGALFAWRTINGQETSAYYPAGTAQYHINADIIYSLKKYMTATEDLEFFLEKGAEMLFETARLWEDLGDYINRDNSLKFCINGVTGPDEYTAIVNNNAFTNLMAKDHLMYAYEMASLLQDKYPAEYKALAEKISLDDAEIKAWLKAAEHMYLPYDKELGIHAQDDSFLTKAVWDFANTPVEKYPLLLHYHPLVIYRHQVLKQADLVLAMYLQGNHFTMAEKKRNYDYYEPITTHDSSLSACIYSIVGAELGYEDKAYNYFKQTARMDLDDINNNVKDGLHTAALAGAWLSIFSGFAGVREYNGVLYFKPSVPEKWEGFRFKVTFKGRLIDMKLTKEDVTYTLVEGERITIFHEKQSISLEANQPVKISLKPELEAVIFDLDGVITDTAEYHYLAWKKTAEKVGVPFDKDFNEKLKGIGRMESLELILEQSDRSFTEAEKIQLAKEKNDLYVELIQNITPSEILPGILSLLKELKENNIKVGLASASKNAFAVVNKLEIAQYFDYIADSAMIKKGKPDPEIFMDVADALNISYKNCVGVEDAEAGIQAIKAANMFAIGIGDVKHLNKADITLSSTKELTLDLLKKEFLER